MTLWLHGPHNGSAVNLLVSQAERTFARTIHNELARVLGVDAIADSIVTRDLRQRLVPTIRGNSPMTHPRPLLTTQFSRSSTISLSLLFGSWRSSLATPPLRSIDI
jgi:hypothetical protein